MPGTAASVTGAGAGAPATRTVDEVLGRLRAIGAGLPLDDGVAVFNRMYLTVTDAVRRRLARPEHSRGAPDRLGRPYFADPAGMAELDVVFAGRYLLALDAEAAGRPVPACWRPLFALRAHRGVHPLQFALAGMNAHIQHDLPLAVLDTCRRLGCGPERLAGDYHRVNDLLAGVETAVREQLMPGPDALERAEPLTHLLGTWSVDTAREAAWATVRALWQLRGVPSAAAALAAALDTSVGLLGRALLTPLGPDRPRAGGAAPPADGPPAPERPTAGRLPVARNRPAVG
ncbi:DUF5995 family protein [Kitasatospora sp. NBC_01246]|uniref:DUF5995 family protein n=1 Tax=Kitasatospora sp. NBC_01246 TaxID=2903570 RepID=UPI002E32B23F|nr:DUF5995 family protein [Kitasatospora sp. NBC_01246]